MCPMEYHSNESPVLLLHESGFVTGECSGNHEEEHSNKSEPLFIVI